jgi:hypothetical protein
MNINSSKDKIIKLENNKEYFVIETLVDNNIDYLLLLNLVDDKKIKIVKKITEKDEDYIVDITDEKDLSNLKSRFKEILEDEQKKILEN